MPDHQHIGAATLSSAQLSSVVSLAVIERLAVPEEISKMETIMMHVVTLDIRHSDILTAQGEPLRLSGQLI